MNMHAQACITLKDIHNACVYIAISLRLMLNAVYSLELHTVCLTCLTMASGWSVTIPWSAKAPADGYEHVTFTAMFHACQSIYLSNYGCATVLHSPSVAMQLHSAPLACTCLFWIPLHNAFGLCPRSGPAGAQQCSTFKRDKDILTTVGCPVTDAIGVGVAGIIIGALLHFPLDLFLLSKEKAESRSSGLSLSFLSQHLLLFF
jgi:hypothetical protein